MIPLSLPAVAEAERSFVTRLRAHDAEAEHDDAILLACGDGAATFAGSFGLVSIACEDWRDLDGDVVLVMPNEGRVERLIRARRGSAPTNTLLITERCDQLCVMCSQPPKKTHVDRFAYLEAACLLAEPDSLIGITGGEPTLYKAQLFDMIERVAASRDDIEFHVLTNAQHFDDQDIERLAGPAYGRVTWGIPLYASDARTHDAIVGKVGAFEQLEDGLACLLRAGCRVELRTVVLTANAGLLPDLADYVGRRLRFIEAWSIMQLENIGFARRRWHELYVDHADDFGVIGEALDLALLRGINAQLFNFPLCTVPSAYRPYARASISDWKRKFAAGCADCRRQSACSGYFEWHPDDAMRVTPL